MKNMNKAIPILVLCLALGVWLTGCASSGKGKPETVNCDAKIHWSVTEQANLTNFGCVLDKHGGQDSLIFNVGLMNPTEKPLRYRVNIFLEDMDKAAGHYVPRKGKPPVIAPGKSANIKIPFIGTKERSKKISVMVTTMGQ